MTKSEFTKPAGQELACYMSELSEAAYAAEWMEGLEYSLWQAVVQGYGKFGRLQLTSDHISKLQMLSDECKGWIIFDDSRGETFVEIDHWRKLYAQRVHPSDENSDS